MSTRMQIAALAMLAAGCAASPVRERELDLRIGNAASQRSNAAPGLSDKLADADVAAELTLDPNDLKRITAHVTNKTRSPIEILWDQGTLNQCACFGGCKTGPRVSSDPPRSVVASGAWSVARLTLPEGLSPGWAAPSPLDLPMVIGGAHVVKTYDLFVGSHERPER